MAFESGSIALRMFYLPEGLPENHIERFAKNAAPPIDTLGTDEINGWVAGRHLLDRVITEDNALYAGYLRLTLMKAERKIPPALLRAECKMEELAEMEARGFPSLKRDIRKEIKDRIIERMLPNMPPHLTGIPIVYDSHSRVLYAGATSEKQVDALTIFFRNATGETLVPVTPEVAALQRKRVDTRDLAPTSFCPDVEDGMAGDRIGQDFLTWLWFFSEARGGIVNLDDSGQFAVIVEGPLMFVHEGSGAHEAVLRKGEPLVSVEAKTALESGKKLRRARLTLARGEEVWMVTLDADEFVFRSLKLPKGEPVDPVSKFHERMVALETFREAFLGLYDRFLDERIKASTWASTRDEIHAWVRDRKTRK